MVVINVIYTKLVVLQNLQDSKWKIITLEYVSKTNSNIKTIFTVVIKTVHRLTFKYESNRKRLYLFNEFCKRN